ncbi:MAG TPA: hypothetical protein VL527_13165 [Dongiaceae bacterium]|jgi:hypothetical protein|nr:hypothetical protein [Dongiaceae bacterium]
MNPPTPEQIAANRANARKSTGPRTPVGKAISCQNAVKHGRLARQVLVRGHKLRESGREFRSLSEAYYRHLAPVGPVESLLVDRIVILAWRLRRGHIAEAGEIALNVDAGWWQRQQGLPPIQQYMQWYATGDPILNMQNSTMGSVFLQHCVLETRHKVAAQGEYTAEIRQDLLRHFGSHPNSLTRELDKKWENSAAAAPEARTPALLALLDRKFAEYDQSEARCRARETKEEIARQAAAVLPAPAVVDKILRYETALERQLHRALNQLERLQLRRQGEVVPPPLSVEFSGPA